MNNSKKRKYPPKKSQDVIVKPAVKHNWSEYQKEIFRNIAKGTGHTMIIARAGASKTTSVVAGCKFIPRGKNSLFCCFNKSIQEELKNKLPSYVRASTIHSAGYVAIKRKFPEVEINRYKCSEIVSEFFSNPKDNWDLIDSICQTVAFCKARLSDSPSKIEEIINEKNIDLCDIEIKEFISYVIKTLGLCKTDIKSIDFDDMVWLPIVLRIPMEKYDYVFVDEGHDISIAQFEITLLSLKPNGRFFIMIDNFQCIYSFASAMPDMMNIIRERLKPTELTLPVCYRCPSKVVDLARNVVPDIKSFEGATEGEIHHIVYEDLIKTITPGSYLLSRINAPLIKWCLILLKNGIPANILGRDIGDGLLYLIKKSRKKTVKDFLVWLDSWAKDEKEKMLARNPKANIEIIADKVECMYNLSDGAKTLDQMKKNIDSLFKDNDESKIVLASSCHKIKGKEANNVFILVDTLRYSFDSLPNVDLERFDEEANIAYVAISRARKNLYFVNKVNKYDRFDHFDIASLHE